MRTGYNPADVSYFQSLNGKGIFTSYVSYGE